MSRAKAALVWTGVAALVLGPLAIAVTSPLLEWREPIYIAASFAGIAGFAVILVQPLLASAVLPGLPLRPSRAVHRGLGVALIALIVTHVAGLWITSPPDVIDALTFTSPTPFSAWGVIAMWAAFAAATLAALRRHLGPRVWRLGHSALVALVAVTTIVHALRIDGTMGTTSKWVLSAAVLAALGSALKSLRTWRLLRRRPR